VPIIDVEDYKAWASITGSSQDTAIASAIAVAQRRLQRYCGRELDSAERTEVHNGRGEDRLQLKAPPIETVTSVTLRLSADSTTVYSGSDLTGAFRWDAEESGGLIGWINSSRGQLRPADIAGTLRTPGWGASRSFPRGFQNIVVVYTGGFAEGEAPADLEETVKLMARAALAAAADAIGATGEFQSENIGAYGYARRAMDEVLRARESELGPFKLARAVAG
jgi:hypothetical protein